MGRLNKLATVAGLTAMSLAVSAPAFAQDDCGNVNLLFNKFVPDSHAFYAGGQKPWAEDVARVTEGRVTVSFPSASLAPTPQQWGMVIDGIADVGLIVNPIESKRLHLPNIGGLPFVGNMAAARGIALWRTHDKFFADAGEYEGVHLVGLFTNAGAGLIAGKTVDSIDDVSGMKFWTVGGPPAAAVEAIGAIPVPAPGPEMFNMFSKGVVDGLATNWGAMKVWNAYRYTKSYVDIPGGLYAMDFSFIMNEDKWNSICEADRNAITTISGEQVAFNVGKEIDDYDVLTKSEVAEQAIPVIKPDPAFMAALEERLAYSHDAWIAKADARGVDGKAALEFYMAQIAELSASTGN